MMFGNIRFCFTNRHFPSLHITRSHKDLEENSERENLWINIFSINTTSCNVSWKEMNMYINNSTNYFMEDKIYLNIVAYPELSHKTFWWKLNIQSLVWSKLARYWTQFANPVLPWCARRIFHIWGLASILIHLNLTRGIFFLNLKRCWPYLWYGDKTKTNSFQDLKTN